MRTRIHGGGVRRRGVLLRQSPHRGWNAGQRRILGALRVGASGRHLPDGKAEEAGSGRPLGVLADTLVVGPDLEWKALELLSSVLNPDAGTNAANVLRGRLRLVVSPHLTAADDWFVFATKGVLKPLILQERTAVEFEALDAHSGSGDAFMRGPFLLWRTARATTRGMGCGSLRGAVIRWDDA